MNVGLVGVDAALGWGVEEIRRIRVLLADDHAIVRASLKALLGAEPDMEVIGEAGNGDEAVRLAARRQPDVVVMDLDMPVLNGMEATRRITTTMPDVRVLALTMYAEDRYLFDVLEAGGSGYVLKSAAGSDLVEAVRTVGRGEAFLYPSGVQLLLQAYRNTAQTTGDGGAGVLSARERDVLRLTAEGYTNQEIAVRLFISTKTVDTDRQRIMEKLGLRHRTELVRYALAQGLISPTHRQLGC